MHYVKYEKKLEKYLYVIIITYYTNYKQCEFRICKLKMKFFMKLNDRGVKVCYLNIIRHLYSPSAGKVGSIWTRVISCES